ncbi:MAG: hypothetical protein KIT62_05755 [Cyclobacteriaceae bacterium]|nr:hypothetical protein [Cyclobacteriaceae bacterium]
MKKIITLLALVSFGAMCHAQKKKDKAPTDWGTYDYSKTFSYKNGGGKKDISKLKRVYIADFVVNQVITAVGKQTGSTNFAKMTVGLSGIDASAYQQMVGELYQQAVEQLKAEGYEVLTDEEVANNKFLADDKGKDGGLFVNYIDDKLYPYKELNNEVVSIRPLGKFAVRNSKVTAGIWYNKFCKAIDAHAVSIALNVNFMVFDGSRLGGARIEGTPVIDAVALMMWNNANGGMWVFPGDHMYGNNTWAKSGINETNSSTTIFGAVKSAYVVEASQPEYLAEIKGILGGVTKTFIKTMINEGK